MANLKTKPIFWGRRSEIYGLENSQVLKLYDADFPKQKVAEEFHKTLAVYDSKALNIPKPIKMTEKEGRAGIIFEQINGTALMDLFQKKPWLYFSYQQKITDIHKQIHQIALSGLPTQQEEFTPIISKSGKFSVSDKKKLLDILNKEYKPALCHGDFHHGNIIFDKSGRYYVIDWMDAFSGDYRLDVALTAVNAATSDTPGHVPSFYRYIYEILKRILKLDRRYIDLYELKKEEMRDFTFLAAGIHLARYRQKNDSLHKKYFELTKFKLSNG